jgi:hypothetical protein
MRLTRFFALAIILAATCIFANAQIVSLNESEVARLKRLVQTDKSAAKQFSFFQKRADESLESESNPIEIITTEGRLKGDPLKTATIEALGDMPKIYALAVVYRVSADEKYLQKATEFLKAWAAKNKPTGDPIDETNLNEAFESYDLIKENLSDVDKTVIENWFRRVAQAEIAFAEKKKGKASSINNWNSHRLKILGEIAWTINYDDLKNSTIEKLKTQLSANLNADGTSWDFLERDALHYHTYDLEPLLELAIIIKRGTETDFYKYETDKGASIAKSVQFLVPFVTGEKTHPEFVNSKVQFDRDRAKNGEQGYISGTIFKPTEGFKTLSLAAWFDPSLSDVVRKARNADSKFPNWQTVLNEVTR